MSFGAPKSQPVDTSAQDRALALQEERQAKLDAADEAKKKTTDARRRGRNLLMGGVTGGDAAASDFGARA